MSATGHLLPPQPLTEPPQPLNEPPQPLKHKKKKLVDTKKVFLWALKQKPLKKYVFIIFFSFSFKTNVVFGQFFLNALKKLITPKNGQNGVFDS